MSDICRHGEMATACLTCDQDRAACLKAPDGHVHVIPGWEAWHTETADCPCGPRLEVSEGMTTRAVMVHRTAKECG